jgi:hypothetical protein
MRVAWEIARAEFDGCDVQALELFKNLFKRERGQQGCETSDSHERKSITAPEIDWANSIGLTANISR